MSSEDEAQAKRKGKHKGKDGEKDDSHKPPSNRVPDKEGLGKLIIGSTAGSYSIPGYIHSIREVGSDETYHFASSTPFLYDPGPAFAPSTGPLAAIQEEIDVLREEKRKLLKRSEQDAETITELTGLKEQLESKLALLHLSERVCEPAQAALRQSDWLQEQFKDGTICPCFVVSIDIRRSTDLMLKAREPRLFADFITALCAELRKTIMDNLGVFDKFTGDGILAFFPETFSGDDAGYRAVTAATLCHERFHQLYRKNRRCFNAVICDTGLGIGIDYGSVQIVHVGLEVTVVGTPVVYACRMGGARPGETLLNEPAHNVIFDRYSAFCDIEETQINFKHEGEMVAYRVRPNAKKYSPAEPRWKSKAHPQGEINQSLAAPRAPASPQPRRQAGWQG